MVGIVVVSHSRDITNGVAELANQVAGNGVRIEPAGGGPDGTLGTEEPRVRAAIESAEQGDGVVVLCDIGSAVLTVRHVLEGRNGDGGVLLADAPLVEGAVAAAVMSSAGMELADVAKAAEEARGASKL